jgi:hypothetical protein
LRWEKALRHTIRQRRSRALTSARQNKLNLYSGKNDALLLRRNCRADDQGAHVEQAGILGIKVRFEGVVTKESGGGVYVESFDEDTQQSYGVYVYGGYSSLAPKFLVPATVCP